MRYNHLFNLTKTADFFWVFSTVLDHILWFLSSFSLLFWQVNIGRYTNFVVLNKIGQRLRFCNACFHGNRPIGCNRYYANLLAGSIFYAAVCFAVLLAGAVGRFIQTGCFVVRN